MIMPLLWWTALLVLWPVGSIAILTALAITGVAIAWDKERRAATGGRPPADGDDVVVDGDDRTERADVRR
jgi:hypothetical protein